MGGLGSKLSDAWSGLGSGNQSYGNSTLDKITTLASAAPFGQNAQQQPQSPQGQAVNFQTPQMPYVAPPQAQANPYLQQRNPFYGG
jgi:hypothetical protein